MRFGLLPRLSATALALIAGALVVVGAAVPAEGMPATPDGEAAAPQSAVQRSGVPLDTAGAAPRRISDATLSRFRENPAFDYRRTESRWWDRTWQWIIETLLEPILGHEAAGPVFQGILYLLLVAAMGTGLYQIMQVRPTVRSPEVEPTDDLSAAVMDARRRGVDLGARIEEAVRQGDHRQGVRLLYLQALRRLADAGAIEIEPARTNRDYLDALRGTEREGPFRTATRVFERVWYGGASVDADTFARIRRLMERAHAPDDA
jgi:hypothetical protein